MEQYGAGHDPVAFLNLKPCNEARKISKPDSKTGHGHLREEYLLRLSG